MTSRNPATRLPRSPYLYNKFQAKSIMKATDLHISRISRAPQGRRMLF